MGLDTVDANKPVFSGGLFTTAQVKIWKEVLNNEAGMAQDWEEKWGIYKAPHRERRPGRREKASSTSATFVERSQSTPSLPAAGAQVVSSKFVPPSAEEEHADDRARVRARMRSLLPQERYKAPVTSSHAIGWCKTRPSLELFGRGSFGRTRDPNLMPDI
mmetsp:Transcript_44232/g.127843  ORF Transcript_44232/g.127843 Transcript_44232/m.127843 type:complete len:160 (+) Transcript_44232:111-590(+)